MAEIVDLRSDTVTRPSEEMRRAMYEAEVADDTYDGDPSVFRLQELAAQKTGKEAALFVSPLQAQSGVFHILNRLSIIVCRKR